MRQEFSEIVSGWTLIDDFDYLTDKIEEVAKWQEKNKPLQEDEEKIIELMIRTQIAKGIKRGDFLPYFS